MAHGGEGRRHRSPERKGQPSTEEGTDNQQQERDVGAPPGSAKSSFTHRRRAATTRSGARRAAAPAVRERSATPILGDQAAGEAAGGVSRTVATGPPAAGGCPSGG